MNAFHVIVIDVWRFLQPCACASTGGLVDTVIEGKTGFHMGRLSVDVRLASSYIPCPAMDVFLRTCMNLNQQSDSCFVLSSSPVQRRGAG